MAAHRSSKLRSIGICAAIAVGTSLGVLAPPALAAPANDQFANRTPLGSQLPVHLSEANAEATRDGFVEIGSFAKGHSIWWEWESPASQWTTVGTCGSGFPTVVGVFEGTELQKLTRLSNGNADEGPGCNEYGSRYTFWAEAGHSYDIAADGNGFYLPPQEPPLGEGTISLAMEATPPPPNDDFAAAIPIEGPYAYVGPNPITEPGGPRELLYQAIGYTWGATAEVGESEHAGVPGGASVWYRWTPPASGEARLSLQFPGGPDLLALYAGTTLTGLTPIGSASKPFESLRAHVDAGTEYRIAVDGAQVAGKPVMGATSINVAVVPEAGSSVSPDTEIPTEYTPGESVPPFERQGAPRSSQPPAPVVGRPAIDPVAQAATFRFHSATPGLTYRCKVDGKRFRACSSPYKVSGLAPGKHRLEVQAHGPGGAISSPAVVHFKVPAAQRHHHSAG